MPPDDLIPVEGPDGEIYHFPADMSPAEIKQIMGRKFPDDVSGAPIGVRAVVGAAPEQDRLANLKKFFPDAAPSGDDNFTFTDPKTKRSTLYNPKGFDVGDVASVGKDLVKTVAGIGGGIAGAALGPEAIPFTGAGASVVAGEGYDTLMGKLAGMVDTRSNTERGIGAATDFAIESTIGKLAPLVPALARKAMTSGKNALTGRSASDIYTKFRAIGANPSAGTISGDKGMQTLEQGISSSVGGAETIKQSDNRLMADLQSEAQRVATDFGPIMEKEDVGAMLKDSATAAIKRFGERSNTLYDDVAKEIPITTKARPHATLNLIAERNRGPLATELPDLANEVQNKQVTKWLDNFAANVSNRPEGKVSYQALKELRMRVGKVLGDPMTYSDFDRAELKQVYGAVTEDMQRVAKLAGPKALKAHQLADRYYSYNMGKNIENLAEVADKKWDMQAFNYALSGSKDAAAKLRMLKRNVVFRENGVENHSVWDAVAGSTLWKAGLAKPGVQGAVGDSFSPATFLTNINKMKEAGTYDALFGGTRYASLKPQLNRLTELTAAVKDAQGQRNFSNTARAMGVLGLISGVTGGAGALATGDWKGAATGAALPLIAPYAAAKLMTSPRFVKWLADTAAKAPNYNGWAAQVGRLVAIGKADPDIREEIHQFLAAMR